MGNVSTAQYCVSFKYIDVKQKHTHWAMHDKISAKLYWQLNDMGKWAGLSQPHFFQWMWGSGVKI